VVGANTTDHVLDSSMFVRALLNGTVKATYLVGARGPEYRRDDQAGTIRWYVYDGLGSVVGEVAPDGTLTRAQSFDVYGCVRTSSGAATTKHKFVGALGHPSDDETGLIYMRARYMDPLCGRSVSEDSVHHGTNWFTYVGQCPTNWVDKSGHMADMLIGGSEELDLEVRAAAGAFSTGGQLIARLSAACTEWSIKLWCEMNGATVTIVQSTTRDGLLAKGFAIVSDSESRIFMQMADTDLTHGPFPHIDLQVGGGAAWDELSAIFGNLIR
jgi:RHS repeat-associated protein